MYDKEKSKTYYIDNKESIKEKARQHYYDNIEKRKKYNNAYWALNSYKYKEIKQLKYKQKQLDKPKHETTKINNYEPKKEETIQLILPISKINDITVFFN